MLAGSCACINVTNDLGSGITHRLGKKTLDPQVGNLLASSLDFGHGDKAFLVASTDRALRAPDSGERSLSRHSLTPYTLIKESPKTVSHPGSQCLLPVTWLQVRLLHSFLPHAHGASKAFSLTLAAASLNTCIACTLHPPGQNHSFSVHEHLR